MAKRKTIPKPVPSPEPDAAVISACIVYAQCVAGVAAGFKADPGGNCDRAGRLGTTMERRADKALLEATAPAATAEGISAKARIVPMMLDEASDAPEWHVSVSPEGVQFLKVLALDAKVFTEKVLAAEHRARVEAERAARVPQ